nr:MAG TPA: hypothetical protein [Caudoviricetes sp.]
MIPKCQEATIHHGRSPLFLFQPNNKYKQNPLS